MFGGRPVIVQNQTVEIMLMMSYGLQKSQIANVPDWVKTDRYDVDGLANVEGQPKRAAVPEPDAEAAGGAVWAEDAHGAARDEGVCAGSGEGRREDGAEQG